MMLSDSADKTARDPFDATVNRFVYLQMLRNLEREDNESRQIVDRLENKEQTLSEALGKVLEDHIIVLSGGKTMLSYKSFLSHQRFYDDWKHANLDYINFEKCYLWNGPDALSLVIEQRKNVGRGGFCYDAAFILSDHLLRTESEWNSRHRNRIRMLELGAGTGLVGIALAKYATRSVDITISDLPALSDLMQSNIEHNGFGKISSVARRSNVVSQRLRWGKSNDYPSEKFDVIVGADTIASIYDPIALAKTCFDLAKSSNSKVFISYKKRLVAPFEEFLEAIHPYFCSVRVVSPQSKNRNVDILIIEITGKRTDFLTEQSNNHDVC